MRKHTGQVLPASRWTNQVKKSFAGCRHKAYSDAKAFFLATHNPSYTQQEIEQRLIDLAKEYGV